MKATSTSVYGPGFHKVRTDPRASTRNPRLAVRGRNVARQRFATIGDALRFRLAAFDRPERAVSVTETTPGWEKRVWLHDDRPGANRSTRRPELIDQDQAFHGKRAVDPAAMAATAERLRRLVAVRREFDHGCMVSGSATREGRPEYRTMAEQRSTVKLGDFAAD